MSTLTVHNVRQMLMINRHRLDEELEVQANIAFQISECVADMNNRQLELKAELDRTEARLWLTMREAAEKATEGEIKARISRDQARVTAYNAYAVARKDHEVWSGLQDAWRQRGFAIRNLCDLYCADYFAVTQTSAQASGGAFARPDRQERSANVEAAVQHRRDLRAAAATQTAEQPIARVRIRPR